MATAQRWWNGSSWSTTQTTWVHINTWTSSSYCYVIADFYIIAYDNGTLGFSGTIEGGGSGTAVCSGSRNITENGNTITTFSMSNIRSQSRTASISSPTATIGWNGSSSVSVWKNDGSGVQYGAAWGSGSGSTTLTSPFQYIITYNDNGGVNGPGVKAVFNGETPTISLIEPTRSNRTFLGWSTSNTSRTAEYAPGDTITLSSNITLYAIWDPADDGIAQNITATYNNSTILTIPSMITICPVVYDNVEIATLSKATTKTLTCQGKVMKSNVVIGSKILTCQNQYMASNIIVTSTTAIYASIDVILSHFPSGTTVTISPNNQYSIETITGGQRVNVTKSGTYTITATYGNITRTGSVTINSYGETKSITFEYYLYLLKGNPIDECTSVHGMTWFAANTRQYSTTGAQRSAPSINRSGTYLVASNGATYTSGTDIKMGCIQIGGSQGNITNNLTGYSKIVMNYDMKIEGSPGTYRKFNVTMFASKSTVWESNYQNSATNYSSVNTWSSSGTFSNLTSSLNISGGGYVQVGIGLNQNSNPGVKGTITIKDIHVEP